MKIRIARFSAILVALGVFGLSEAAPAADVPVTIELYKVEGTQIIGTGETSLLEGGLQAGLAPIQPLLSQAFPTATIRVLGLPSAVPVDDGTPLPVDMKEVGSFTLKVTAGTSVSTLAVESLVIQGQTYSNVAASYFTGMQSSVLVVLGGKPGETASYVFRLLIEPR